MHPLKTDPQPNAVLGQKYAFATASLILGVACYINMLGLEKALLAMLFAWLALKAAPEPKLVARRTWARVGFALGLLLLIVVPTVLLLNIHRIRVIVEALQKLQWGR